MNHVSRSNRSLAAFVAILLLVVSTPTALAAPDARTAVFEGRVFEADGTTPRAGVVVALADAPGGTVWDSQPTSEDGAFRVDTAPTGEYAVLLRDGDQVYLAADRVPLRAGESVPVSVAIHPSMAPAQSDDRGIPRWGEWLITGSIVVIGAFLVNEIATSTASEPSSSPF